MYIYVEIKTSNIVWGIGTQYSKNKQQLKDNI